MKRTSLIILCLIAAVSAKAQNWGGGVDDDNLHFGFTFQYLSSEYKILKKANWRGQYVDEDPQIPNTPGLRSISSKPTPGFGIGFVVNKRLGENADLRFTPILVFSDRSLSYEYTNANANIDKKISTTLVDFPIGIKIKSDRRTNFRAYVIGGVKFTTDITSKKKTDNSLVTDPAEKFINNARNFMSYEAGLGFDLYFEYFKMSPELKLSYSMKNVLENEPTRYVAPLDKLMLRHVTFSLFFE
ncbi:type IX secretion/gliding motility protein PorT/SprT [Pedobacter metabolipauper]|uniref:Outer membrane protein beta-barrel domain-containing protein n=1 Tax=Pedobacter metabolipauper TaxID=425513 RepID=A0A4R6SUC1_9SPHI|nr:outer membrane beta-barrel protein [Pedobacter metabolipauper]TDQ07387.1 putative protein-translocating porin PorT [Pedobacter metabolipauper]